MRPTRYLRWLSGSLALGIAPLVARSQQQAAYAGSASCVECHRTTVQRFLGTTMGKLIADSGRLPHGGQGCESCHGPSQRHVRSGGDERPPVVFTRTTTTPVSQRNAVCLQCHEKTARLFWQGSQHESRKVACTDCHTVMHPESERANLKKPSVIETCGRCHQQRRSQALRFSHMPIGEGKMECTSCHNPHGSPNDKLLIAPTVNEVCFSCHAEKRGPFLWQHPPVVENCANCHEPHGSNHEKLLKVPKPRLCQQCHDPTFHPTQPRATIAGTSDVLPADARFLRNRQCTNCHFNLHGSNHPGGHGFTR